MDKNPDRSEKNSTFYTFLEFMSFDTFWTEGYLKKSASNMNQIESFTLLRRNSCKSEQAICNGMNWQYVMSLSFVKTMYFFLRRINQKEAYRLFQCACDELTHSATFHRNQRHFVTFLQR